MSIVLIAYQCIVLRDDGTEFSDGKTVESATVGGGAGFISTHKPTARAARVACPGNLATLKPPLVVTVASEAYHDWSGEAAGGRLRVNFTLKLLLSQNFCNRPLMRFISFASNIGPAAAVPAGPALAPLC